MLKRGFRRIVWLLKPTTPSAAAGAAAQVPTQRLSLGMTILAFSHSSCRGGLELLTAVEVTHTKSTPCPRTADCVAQQPLRQNWRDGSQATDLRWSSNVRFPPQSDQTTAPH